jgi:hypothetical protein
MCVYLVAEIRQVQEGETKVIWETRALNNIADAAEADKGVPVRRVAVAIGIQEKEGFAL